MASVGDEVSALSEAEAGAESYHTAGDNDGAETYHTATAQPEPTKPSAAVTANRPPPQYTRRQIWYIALAGTAIVIVGVVLVVGIVLGVNPKGNPADASDSSWLPEGTSEEVGGVGDIATLGPSAAPSEVTSGAPSFVPSDAPSPAASDAPSALPSKPPTPSPTDAIASGLSNLSQAILSTLGDNDTTINVTETPPTAQANISTSGGNDTTTNITESPPPAQDDVDDTTTNITESPQTEQATSSAPGGNDTSTNATGQPVNIATTTNQPTKEPTGSPTNKPLSTTGPTASPTLRPSLRPTQSPTASVQTAAASSPPTQITPFNISSWLDALASISLGGEPQQESTDSNTVSDGQSDAGSGAQATTAATLPTPRPSRPPTAKQTSCFTSSTYDAIDRDIERLANNIQNIAQRSHFLGGIVRLAAHDFMDFDRRSSNPMGPDGCFDAAHPGNAGLPGDIWCANCTLTLLHEESYSHISRADFWIAAANAVTRQTSVNNGLDLRDTFVWGRRDADACAGQGERLPTPAACSDVEDVFLVKMGLTWSDAAALMGAHSLGRGDRRFSGHHGTWSSSNQQSLIFDKRYYGEIYLNSWRPRNNGGNVAQDFTTGQPSGHPRVMLATDLCLVYDIDNRQCCTHGMLNGQSGCLNSPAASRRCPMVSPSSSRFEARQAVGTMLGGPYPNDNNEPFYNNYREAWRKATTVGQQNLSPLVESCV